MKSITRARLATALCVLSTTAAIGDDDPLGNLDFEGVMLPHFYLWQTLFPDWDGAGGVGNIGLNVPAGWESAMRMTWPSW